MVSGHFWAIFYHVEAFHIAGSGGLEVKGRGSTLDALRTVATMRSGLPFVFGRIPTFLWDQDPEAHLSIYSLLYTLPTTPVHLKISF